MRAARALFGLLLLQTGWERIQSLRGSFQVLYKVT